MKEVQPAEKVVKSLLALKEELWNRYGNENSGSIAEICMKINSCLFSEYPINRKKENA